MVVRRLPVPCTVILQSSGQESSASPAGRGGRRWTPGGNVRHKRESFSLGDRANKSSVLLEHVSEGKEPLGGGTLASPAWWAGQ